MSGNIVLLDYVFKLIFSYVLCTLIFSYFHIYIDIFIVSYALINLRGWNPTPHHPAPPSTPQYSLHYKFSVTHPDFTQIYLRIIFGIFFFQNSNWFLQCQRFVKTKLFLAYIFCWSDEYNFDNNSRIRVQKF